MVSKDHFSFSPTYSASLGSPVPLDAWPTWDPELLRQPRLLVPVDVQALVVRDGEKERPADVAVTTLDRVGVEGVDRDGDRAAPPFTDQAKLRPPGVHLHWAIPDGLTRGTVTDAATLADDGDTEAEVGDGQLDMPALPDRWLVVRIEAEAPHRLKSWVVESERGRAVALDAWPREDDLSDAATPDLRPADVTATMGGDAAWAAVYDNVANRFAFHDDLAGLQGGEPLSYAVVGWYSDPDLDPLGDAHRFNVLDLLDDLGWSSTALADAAIENRLTLDGFASTTGASVKLSTAGQTVLDGTGTAVGVPFQVGTVAGAAAFGDAVPTVSIAEVPWYPNQCVFHGRIEGVRTTVVLDERPEAAGVTAAVGTTAAESLSALMAADEKDLADEAERLQTSFLYGLMDTYEEADGIPRLEEEMHRRGFEAVPGGTTPEWVRRGDALARFRGPATAPVLRGEDGPLGGKPVFDFAKGDRGDAIEALGKEAALQDQRSADQRRAAGLDQADFVRIDRPAPRLFYPQDPIVTIEGLNRSLRFGGDGLFDDDGLLVCRISSEIQDEYDGILAGRDLLVDHLDNGAIPLEAHGLVEEAVVLCTDYVDDHAVIVGPQLGVNAGIVLNRLKAETTMHLYGADGSVDFAQLTTNSLQKGSLASPIATTYWQQPWIPVYLEWQLELQLGDGRDWKLGEIDFAPPDGPAPVSGRLAGRSLLGSASTKALAAQIDAFLVDEDNRDATQDGLVDEATEALLQDLVNDAEMGDRMNAALDGLYAHLLGFESNEAVGQPGDGLDDPAADEPEPSPTELPELLRAGHATLTRLRVVDCFGRTLDLAADDLPVAENIETPLDGAVPGTTFELPPRINTPSRLWFRFVDPTDARIDARLDQRGIDNISPITAWLMPDHVDRALELFDPVGRPLGQLRHESLGGGVVWEGAPGLPGSVGAPPSVEDLGPHASAFVRAIVARDASERAGRALPSDDPSTSERESPLNALLRVIDTTLWTVDPYGTGGNEHLATMTGHPLAVVRARLTLDVPSDTDRYPDLTDDDRAERDRVFAELAQRSFAARLGALTRTQDGLIGYFVDDDYSLFHPVHRSVLTNALPSGPGHGHLRPANGPIDLTPEAITAPYVARRSSLPIRPGQTVLLTLLMVPGGRVHATSGILPRKSIGLMRDWTSEALERISPSFRVGPVLVDPATIRLPRPNALPDEQVWTRRDSPVSWRDDPLLAATQDALLPDTSAAAQEGYIRVRVDESESGG